MTVNSLGLYLNQPLPGLDELSRRLAPGDQQLVLTRRDQVRDQKPPPPWPSSDRTVPG